MGAPAANKGARSAANDTFIREFLTACPVRPGLTELSPRAPIVVADIGPAERTRRGSPPVFVQNSQVIERPYYEVVQRLQ
jgi:hypothetical protein